MPEFFKGIGPARIGAMAGVAAALTGFFLYVFGMIAEPPKAILFSGLEAREATSVIAKLEALNIPYEQKGDGGTILIASDQVSKIRMQLAAEGMPSAGVGYEIFDKTDTFGTTAFVQNLNRLRALEGELARTIKSLDSIDSARVHLVIPDRQIFARDNQPPSASVVVKARARLSRGQVNAIQHLVAAAVSGLVANNVALIDDKGELLGGGGGGGVGEGDAATSAAQEERTSGFEDRLRTRVENIVSSIVGPGHSRVQVAADMDFNRVTQTAETYDPDSRVVRSSQTVQQDSNSKDTRPGAAAVSVGNALPGQTPPATPPGDGSQSANSRTEETINYEISKTTKTETQDAGQVKKLSVAVVVDGTYTPGANGQRGYAPRSGDDMGKITALVRSAIGFDEKRGDQLQVTNMRFADIDAGTEATPAPAPIMGLDSSAIFKLAQVAILSITALLVFLLVVRPMIRRLTIPLPTTAGGATAISAPGQPGAPQLTQAAGDGAAGQQGQSAGAPAPLAIPRRESTIDISQIDGQVRESAIRKVGDVVQAHPEEAMAILRTWMHQPV